MDNDERNVLEAYGSITIVREDGSTFEASSEDQILKDIAKKGEETND